MIPREVMRKIRRIQIHTSHIVDNLLAGPWHSAFKGRGIEFEEVRPYQVGDDVRTIDWNVTARAGEPFVKLFREEREMSVMLLVDLSASQDFGTNTANQTRTGDRIGCNVGVQCDQEQRQSRTDSVHRPDRKVGAATKGNATRAATDSRTALLPTDRTRHEFACGTRASESNGITSIGCVSDQRFSGHRLREDYCASHGGNTMSSRW